jgi:cyclohexadienyl dehydratase
MPWTRILCLFLALLPWAAPVLAGERLDAMEKAGVVRVGLTADYMPFSGIDPKSGGYWGLDVDLARSMAAALGLRLQIVRTSWPTLSADLEAGKFDVGMGGISVTDKRKAVGFFSVPMMSDGKTPITACGDVDRFATIAQINQPRVRVIVNPGGTNEKFARAHFPKAQIAVLNDNTKIFEEIAAGRADVMVTDAIEARWQAKRNKALCAVHPDTPFDRAEKAYFMPKDAELKALVDEWLTRLDEIGALQRKIDVWVR